MTDASQLGGYLEPQQLAGHRYEVRFAETVEYRVTVMAGVEEDDAIREAREKAHHTDDSPFDRDIVHTEVEAVEDIWADDPRAEQIFRCYDTQDEPTAPSENTFWDDTEHFSESTREEYRQRQGAV